MNFIIMSRSYENFHGRKGRSGRKSRQEELKGAIEKITNEALIELAKNKVFKQLNQEIDFNQTKEMALPIALKDIANKTDLTSGGLKISFDKIFNDSSHKTKGSDSEQGEI
jgi:hypothetical protein